MPIIRYKARPITASDAVLWDGMNIAEVQALCPQVGYNPPSTTLTIPSDYGTLLDANVGDVILRTVGRGRMQVLGADVFDALYEPQQPAEPPA